jgi:hypothetical protein
MSIKSAQNASDTSSSRAPQPVSGRVYGGQVLAPRVFLDLQKLQACSEHRVARLMRQAAAGTARLSHAAVVRREAVGPDSNLQRQP